MFVFVHFFCVFLLVYYLFSLFHSHTQTWRLLNETLNGDLLVGGFCCGLIVGDSVAFCVNVNPAKGLLYQNKFYTWENQL